MDDQKRFDKIEITEDVVKDPKALAGILDTLIEALFKPGGYVWRIGEDGLLTKNVVDVLVKLLLRKGVVRKADLKTKNWLPLGETGRRLGDFRIEDR